MSGELRSIQASVVAIFLCVLFGANAVAIKFTLTGLGTFTAAAVRFSIAVVAIFLYICAFLFDKPMMNSPGGGVVAAILYQGLITGSFGFVAWNALLQRYGAVSLHTFIFIMPVVGVLLGGLLLKEPITGNILIALALIGTGIFVAQFNKKERLEVQRIHTMIRFFESDACISRQLAGYFGEYLEQESCGHCSFCKSGKAVLKNTSALKPLSYFNFNEVSGEFIRAVGERFSEVNLTKFLCGIYTPVFSKLKIKKLPYFGILEKHPFLEVKSWIEEKNTRQS